MGLEGDRSNEEGYEWMNFFPMKEGKEGEKKMKKRQMYENHFLNDKHGGTWTVMSFPLSVLMFYRL